MFFHERVSTAVKNGVSIIASKIITSFFHSCESRHWFSAASAESDDSQPPQAATAESDDSQPPQAATAESDDSQPPQAATAESDGSQPPQAATAESDDSQPESRDWCIFFFLLTGRQ